MARNPYRKRTAQGAAQGAMSGATAGYMLGGPLGGTLGLIGGGVAGGLMARPGEDEQRYRARMRQLELGVLGPEEAAIRGRFMDPVRGTANEQMVRSRAVTPASGATGAQAREAIAGQREARRDIGEAAAEAEMAIMDLGERRRGMADRMRDLFRREEDQRTRQFRAQMADDLVGLGTTVGGDIAQQRLQEASEKASLADQVGAGRGRRNRADLAAMSDEVVPVAGEPSPVKVSGLGDYAMRAAASREAKRRLGAIDDPSSVEAAAPAAAAPPVAPAAAPPAAPAYSAADTDTLFGALGLSRPLTAAEQVLQQEFPAVPEMGLGAQGEDVEFLNFSLSQLGFPTGGASQSFDASTESAVRQVQSDAGLPETGVVDAATMSVLRSRQAERMGAAQDAIQEYEEFKQFNGMFPSIGIQDWSIIGDSYKAMDGQGRKDFVQGYGPQIGLAGEL